MTHALIALAALFIMLCVAALVLLWDELFAKGF